MPLRKTICLSVMILCAACLIPGDTPFVSWERLAAAAISLLAWLLAWKWPSTWLPATALVVSVSLAVIGLFAGASPFFTILSATLALASWDLALLGPGLAECATVEMSDRLEKKHYQSLALALVPALIGAAAGRLIQLTIPFAGMALLVVLAVFSLERARRALFG